MRILAYTSPARGHLYPLVPVLDELARRGHTIALRTLSSQVGAMTDRGFDAAPIAPASMGDTAEPSNSNGSMPAARNAGKLSGDRVVPRMCSPSRRVRANALPE